MSKYRFKKQYADAQIQVTGRREVITKDNLTDEDVEWLSKRYPQVMHNFEPADGSTTESTDGEFELEEFLKLNYKKRVKAVGEITDVDVLTLIRENDTAQTVISAVDERMEALAGEEG